MILRTLAAAHSLCLSAWRRLAAARAGGDRGAADAGQTTAEYALVIVGAAAVALLVLTWATGTGRIGWLLDKIIDTVANMVN